MIFERCMGDETSVQDFLKEVKGLLFAIHFTIRNKKEDIQ